jgi:hypothetical protein
MHLPFKAAAFIFPRGVLKHTSEGECCFLWYARLRSGTIFTKWTLKTDEAKNLREHPLPGPMIDGNLPPHQAAVDTAGVNEFRDMREPGVYTIQVQEGSVKSNTVTVTVTP